MLLSGAPFSSVSLSAVYPNQVYTIETDIAWNGGRKQTAKHDFASRFVYTYEPDYLHEFAPLDAAYRPQIKTTRKDALNGSGLTLEPTYHLNQSSESRRIGVDGRRFTDDSNAVDLVPFEFCSQSTVGKSADRRINKHIHQTTYVEILGFVGNDSELIRGNRAQLRFADNVSSVDVIPFQFINESTVGKSIERRVNHQINQIGYVESFIFVSPQDLPKPIQVKNKRFEPVSYVNTVELPVSFEYASDTFSYRSMWKNRYQADVYPNPIYPVIPGLRPDDRPVSGSPDDDLSLTGIDLGDASGTGTSLYSETATGIAGYSQSYTGLGGYSIAVSGIRSGQSLVGYGGAMISISGNKLTTQAGTGVTLGSGIDGTETIERDATGVDLGAEDGSGRPPN